VLAAYCSCKSERRGQTRSWSSKDRITAVPLVVHHSRAAAYAHRPCNRISGGSQACERRRARPSAVGRWRPGTPGEAVKRRQAYWSCYYGPCVRFITHGRVDWQLRLARAVTAGRPLPASDDAGIGQGRGLRYRSGSRTVGGAIAHSLALVRVSDMLFLTRHAYVVRKQWYGRSRLAGGSPYEGVR
jgi:hypothetical protein